MFPRVTHPCASHSEEFDRLACVRPAASVRSEPGSNSQVDLEPTSELAQFWSIAFQDVRLAVVGPLTSDSRPRIPSVSLQCPTAVGRTPGSPKLPCVKPGRNPISSRSVFLCVSNHLVVVAASGGGLYCGPPGLSTSFFFFFRPRRRPNQRTVSRQGRFVTRPALAVNPLFSLRFSVQPEDRSASGGGL